jgi:hypothetical protein
VGTPLHLQGCIGIQVNKEQLFKEYEKMSNTMPSAESMLSGGMPSAKFPVVGTTITGTVTADPEVRQATQFGTGEPLFWDDGRPKMEIVLTIATDARDAEIDGDDGTRRVFIKGQMLTAARAAIQNAKVKNFAPGGKVTITYARDGKPSKPGYNPPKEYTMTYEAPGLEDLVAPEATPAPTPAAAPEPAPAAPTANLADVLTPEQLAVLQKANLGAIN